MTPLIFSRYADMSVNFTTDSQANNLACDVASEFKGVAGELKLNLAVFTGRIGFGRSPESRSLRRVG